jgi:hypothetical protein
MKSPGLLLPLAAVSMLTGCVAPVGPVEVTRFHLPDTARLGRGAVTVEPAPGTSGDSLEWRAYAGAVGRQLALAGYAERPAADQVALVTLQRQVYQPRRNRGPISVGVGGATGSYGSGLGLGIGIDLSGPPPDMVETELAVTIRDRAGGQSLWEGRARFVVSAKSPLANTELGAAKLAEALFKGFPGRSGETIEVR